MTAAPSPTINAEPAEATRTLCDLAPGREARIVAVQGTATARRRLLEMGLTPGTQIRMLRCAPLGDPLAVLVRGYQLSLRRSQASLVEIRTDVESEAPPEQAADSRPEAVLSDAWPIAADAGTVALVGNPNSGKTTLFNALTGLRQKVANYPGVTVEKRLGSWVHEGTTWQLLDLPGTYSCSPTSPDERVVVDVLRGEHQNEARPQAVILVLDAAHLGRNLLLASQVMDLGVPMVVALSMNDVAASYGRSVLPDRLSELLGVPVVPVAAHRGEGLLPLMRALSEARRPRSRPWAPPQAVQEESGKLARLLQELFGSEAFDDPELAAERLLGDADPLLRPARCRDERLVVALRQGQEHLREQGLEAVGTEVEARYRWIDAVLPRVVADPSAVITTRRTLRERIDSVLVHRLWGLLIFASVMAGLFVSIFALATPLMDAVEGGITAFGDWATAPLGDGVLGRLLRDGVVAGVGAVLVFVPQIALLVAFLAALEDSGYLARAAFLMDRLFARLGLSGRSFVPLLSSHACAIPGILATRGIERPRDRLVTIFVAPFMSCSARLPVYALLIGSFFAADGAVVQGLLLLGCYALGILVAVGTAAAFKLFGRQQEAAPFLLELPAYQLPKLDSVLRAMVHKSWLFIRKAGTVILAFSILLWAGLNYPALDEGQRSEIAAAHGTTPEAVAATLAEETDSALAPAVANDVAQEWQSATAAHSIAGRLGHLIEPVIEPLGYDWRIGIGLIGSFAAREVFVSTMGITYAVGEVEEDSGDGVLANAIRQDRRDDGSLLWNPAMALGLLAFFVIAMQCVSTMAVVKQETGGWRWPLIQWAYMNVLAWIVAFLIYRVAGALL